MWNKFLIYGGGGFCNFARGETMVFQGYQKSNCIRGRERETWFGLLTATAECKGRKGENQPSPNHPNMKMYLLKMGKGTLGSFEASTFPLFGISCAFIPLGIWTSYSKKRWEFKVSVIHIQFGLSAQPREKNWNVLFISRGPSFLRSYTTWLSSHFLGEFSCGNSWEVQSPKYEMKAPIC